MRGDEGFEGGFATEKRAGQLKEEARVATHQDEERVDEGVGFDEGAIQIDAKGLAANRCCVGSG